VTATKSLAELSDANREKFLAKDDRLVPDGEGGIKSPYFHIRPGIVCDPQTGEPMYDRPLISERPSVMAVVWGIDVQDGLQFGLIRQQRPPADDPNIEGDDHPPVTFAQVPMGYLDGDTPKVGALREMQEELGSGVVVRTELFKINLEPNAYASWHNVVLVEVDLTTIQEAKAASDEFISSVVFMPAKDVLANIAKGRDDIGAYYRGGSTLAPFMIFFSKYPEYFPR
jgi:8-oxo-dGTP pyrophosphatase MutT (NUDIX family)